MTAGRRMVFFLILEDELNYKLERKLEQKKELVVGGHTLGN